MISAIDKGLKPYKKLFRRQITRDDIIKLTEIKIKRISKFDSSRADEHIRGIEGELEEVANHLGNIIPYTINYYRQIKKKYGKKLERRTEIRSFETIEASKVVAVNPNSMSTARRDLSAPVSKRMSLSVTVLISMISL